MKFSTTPAFGHPFYIEGETFYLIPFTFYLINLINFIN